MRVKMQVQSKVKLRDASSPLDGAEKLHLSAVNGDDALTLVITDPTLHCSLVVGRSYYVDFTEATD